MFHRSMALARAGALLAASLAISACGTPEDPARVALRERIKQEDRLYDDELKRFIDEAARSVEGKTVRIREGNRTSDLDDEQREVVLGMLTETAGVFDEGLRTEGDAVSRVLNAPGLSPNPEFEATRRLWIDVETFLPRHFDFSFFLVDLGNYSYDLVVEE